MEAITKLYESIKRESQKLLAARLEHCTKQRMYIPANATMAKMRARVAIIASVDVANGWFKECYID